MHSLVDLAFIFLPYTAIRGLVNTAMVLKGLWLEPYNLMKSGRTYG